MMKIIKDVDLAYETEKYDVILIGTNVYQMLSNGFQGKMVNKYPIIQEENDEKTGYADMRLIGKRFTIRDMKPIISLCYIVGYPYPRHTSVHYDALEQCVATAAAEFKGMKVATTVMGSSRFDGNGDHDECLRLIEENCKDLDLTVYDYEQVSLNEERHRLYKESGAKKCVGRPTKTEQYIRIKAELQEQYKKLYLIKNNK